MFFQALSTRLANATSLKEISSYYNLIISLVSGVVCNCLIFICDSYILGQEDAYASLIFEKKSCLFFWRIFFPQIRSLGEHTAEHRWVVVVAELHACLGSTTISCLGSSLSSSSSRFVKSSPSIKFWRTHSLFPRPSNLLKWGRIWHGQEGGRGEDSIIRPGTFKALLCSYDMCVDAEEVSWGILNWWKNSWMPLYHLPIVG